MGELDFAGTEQLNDEEFLRSEPPGDGEWGQASHVCGGGAGFGVYPFDIATIFYRRSRWAVVGAGGGAGPLGGCMERVRGAAEHNYRSFVAQAFEHTEDGTRVVVVAAHNPHTRKYAKEIGALATAVRTLQERTGAKRLILIADTNWEHPESVIMGKSSQGILEDVYPGAGPATSTELHLTCCAWSYVHTFDRIIAAGFSGRPETMRTTLPFNSSVPPWVALYMHSPIIGWLDLGA